MNRWKKRIACLLTAALLLQMNPVYTRAAETQYRVNVEVSVDGAEAGVIPALDDTYENNMYLSLRGLAHVLAGTDKAFTPVIEKKKITIATGADSDVRFSAWDGEALRSTGRATAAKHELLVDEEERKYYSFILPYKDEFDAFLTPVSLAMMFDMDIKVTEDRIEIDTAAPFFVTAAQMEESGYFQGVNALLIGDGSTGEIFYQYEQDVAFPIASTTKLMTYFVFMEAVSRGECSLSDSVRISERASVLSNGSDGVIPMLAGARVPVSDLLYGMLIPSSNESALALAEYAAGSQEAFVERMNETARSFGWDNAEFYNCHGLPSYVDQLIPAKLHNHMTAEEMFRLASLIMDTYPQVTEITAARTYHMDSFNIDLKNTNTVIYNMENAVGLKTGTTNKAGACLVTCVNAEKDGETHHLITVLFGADGDASRGLVSEMAARYAMNALRYGWICGEGDPEDLAEEEVGIPEDPERVMKRLIGMLF